MISYQQMVEAVKAEIKEVDVAALMSALNAQSTVLIDVREPSEYSKGRIEQSVNYPRGILESQLCQHPSVAHHSDSTDALEELGKKPVYLICRSGARTALAAQSLQNMGFENVMSVAGGMLAWEKAEYPVKV